MRLLSLGVNQLSEIIPASVTNLSQLYALDIFENRLIGEIPSGIGNLTNLSKLGLSGNQLTGAIPNSIGDLTQLEHLFLGDNQLDGSIPPSICKLTKLEVLGLENNKLTGPIPPRIGELVQLQELGLSDNHLTGPIPNSVSNLTQMCDLDLSNNQLSGDIPNIFGNRAIPHVVWIQRNNFEFSTNSIQTLKDLDAAWGQDNNFGDRFVRWDSLNIAARRLLPAAMKVSGTDPIDWSVDPKPDSPKLLASQPELGLGVVADGVAPVLLHLTRDSEIDQEQTYQLEVSARSAWPSAVSDADLAARIQQGLLLLYDGKWVSATPAAITFKAGQSNAFAYIMGIPMDQVPAHDPSVVTIKGMDGTNQKSATSFKIRRPPVALVHGYNTTGESWQESFTKWVPFSYPINYGVSSGLNLLNPFTITGDYIPFVGPLIGIPRSFANTYGSLAVNAVLLDQALKQTMENPNNSAFPLKDWFYLRYDVVAHSQGGVLTRMLCSQRAYDDSATFYGTRYPRGRFHRIVTIGSPHNGNTLVYYLEELKRRIANPSQGIFNSAAASINSSLAWYLNASGVLQAKFNPWGDEIRALHGLSVDERARFHCLTTSVDFNRSSPPPAQLAVGMGPDRAAIVFPFGSDGIVDRMSQSGGPGTKVSSIIGENISEPV